MLSATALGLGAVHCIMGTRDKYKRSQRTAAGADKWLDTRLWDTTASCLGSLKEAGYQVVATHLSASSVTIQVNWHHWPTSVGSRNF
jgi:tRNA (guanosine-2'-O-)-methyltransferase